MGRTTRIAVAGAAGRMGRVIVRCVLEDPECSLAGALESSHHSDLGRDAGTLAGSSPAGVSISTDTRTALSAADVLIDFTTPDVSVALSMNAAEMGVTHVIGTTGFSDAQEQSIATAARKIAIVKSGNMSMGVALLASLVRRAAKTLPDFDVEIVEMHHRMKTDAPSGTALLLGRAAAEGRGLAIEAARAPARAGTGLDRKPGEIGFASLRGGTVVGDHHVIFAGAQERMVLGHIAEDRAIFARGAIVAAKWGRLQKPGLYAMDDVLGISE